MGTGVERKHHLPEILPRNNPQQETKVPKLPVETPKLHHTSPPETYGIILARRFLSCQREGKVIFPQNDPPDQDLTASNPSPGVKPGLPVSNLVPASFQWRKPGAGRDPARHGGAGDRG